VNYSEEQERRDRLQAAVSQSQTAVATNLIALYKALGGGWESFPQ